MSYKDKTDQELIQEGRKLRRQLVEIELRLKEIYLMFKNIKIHESNNNRCKVDKGV
jgi:hypothetical protein